MKQSPSSRQWRLWPYANNESSIPWHFDESIRSISSEGSTIAVDHTLAKQVQEVPLPRSSIQQSQSQILTQPDDDYIRPRVHFSTRPPQIIPHKPKRRVRIALEHNEVHAVEPATQSVPACQLWYTEREYAALEQSRQEQCHYFGDRPWFAHLTRAYRALRDGDKLVAYDEEDNDNDDSPVASPPSDIETLIGLEHWMINTARRTRRREILCTMRHWQRTAPALPSVRQRQVARVSAQQSQPARHFAHYVAQQVAESVQHDG